MLLGGFALLVLVAAAVYGIADRRGAVAAGLLQATSLPFLVTATQIGLLLGEITPVTAAALVSAGLLSVIVFPIVALSLLRGSQRDAEMPRVQPPLANVALRD